MNTAPKIQITNMSLRLTPELKKDIDEFAWRRKMSAQKYIRESIEKAIAKDKKRFADTPTPAEPKKQ